MENTPQIEKCMGICCARNTDVPAFFRRCMLRERRSVPCFDSNAFSQSLDKLLVTCENKSVAAVSFQRLTKLRVQGHCRTVNFDGVSFGMGWLLASSVLLNKLVVPTDGK